MDFAVKSELVEQVRAFVDWVGTGRRLTETGRITLAEARMLVERLGTDDVIDPTIGDRVFRTTSSQELLHLTLIVEWTKSARLVRTTGHRLVPVKKNQALLGDAQALWLALFMVFGQLGEAFLPSGFGESLLRREFAIGIRAVLTSLYRTDGAVVTANLCATAWDVVMARYVLDHATETQLKHAQAVNGRDTKRALEVLRRLGAVTIEKEAASSAGPVRAGSWASRARLDSRSQFDPAHFDPTKPTSASPPWRTPITSVHYEISTTAPNLATLPQRQVSALRRRREYTPDAKCIRVAGGKDAYVAQQPYVGPRFALLTPAQTEWDATIWQWLRSSDL